jgi:hypothetical protein
MKQTFRVTVRVDAEVESSGEPYLTDQLVKKQINHNTPGDMLIGNDLP